jgi:RimJ/RimL family protein N-acetyltransferase
MIEEFSGIAPEIELLIGSQFVLRGIKESDIDDRFAIGINHEFVHMCGGESLQNPEFPDRSVWETWYRNNKSNEYSWIIEFDGRCIGGAGFHHISKEDNSATYRIGIFNVRYHSKGIGTEVTQLLLKYGFEYMKWHRIDLKVLEYNTRGIRCYEKCGFRKDGVLRESAFIDGKYYSDIIMSILDYEYQEIQSMRT